MSQPTYRLALCCNLSANGLPAGRLRALDIESPLSNSIRLDAGFLIGERDRHLPACTIENGVVQIAHRRYPIHGHIAWYGNWCWDAVRVDRLTMRDIVLQILRLERFDLDEAPTDFFDAWGAHDAAAVLAALNELLGVAPNPPPNPARQRGQLRLFRQIPS